jgi:hypothetical protein
MSKVQPLPKEERIDNMAWSKGEKQCDTKILNIFLGNLWTKQHVKSDFETSPVMAEVRKVVPPKNIVRLDSERIFFMLPLDISKPRKIGKDLASLRARLFTSLKKYSIFMKRYAYWAYS